jgi:hypothetical protein
MTQAAPRHRVKQGVSLKDDMECYVDCRCGKGLLAFHVVRKTLPAVTLMGKRREVQKVLVFDPDRIKNYMAPTFEDAQRNKHRPEKEIKAVANERGHEGEFKGTCKQCDARHDLVAADLLREAIGQLGPPST